jgi:hypothetical protein
MLLPVANLEVLMAVIAVNLNHLAFLKSVCPVADVLIGELIVVRENACADDTRSVVETAFVISLGDESYP